MSREFMEDFGIETGGVAQGPKYTDVATGLDVAWKQYTSEADPDKAVDLKRRCDELEQLRNGLVEKARGMGLLDQLDRLIDIEVEEGRAKRIPSPAIRNLIEEELSGEKEKAVPEELRGLKRDHYHRRIQAELVAPEQIPPDSEGQIAWLSEHMSALESSGRSYREMGYDPNFIRITGALPRMRVEAQEYFRARYHIFEAWLLTPNVGGSIDAFTKLGEVAGAMSLADTMLSRQEVAEAFVDFETLSQGEDLTKNPARASALGLQAIRLQMALDLAKRRGLVGEGVTLASMEGRLAAEKFSWAIRQAETLWRMWMRAALADGLVFKDGVNLEVKERLLSLRPTEIRDYWEELEGAINWEKSFEGRGESAVRRLLYSGLFFQKTKAGEARMRPYLYFGSKDFFSNFIDEKFLKDGNNFRPLEGETEGRGFVLDNLHPSAEDSAEPDYNFDRVYVKRNREGEVVERVTIKRNGVVVLDKDMRLDLTKIKWTAKGEAAYVGSFLADNLVAADGIRKAVMDPEKLARDPALKNLTDLYGSLDSFTSIRKDIEDGKDPDKERARGKIYREDMFMMLGLGVLDFQMHDLERKYNIPNITWSQVDHAINSLRIRGMVDDNQVEAMKQMTMSVALQGRDLSRWVNNFIRSLRVKGERIDPMAVFLAMLAEIFKQAFSQK